MSIILWAVGVALIFGAFVWWNHRHAEVAERGCTVKHVESKSADPVLWVPTKRRKPRRKGYAGHGRIPRTGGWY